MNSWAGWVCIFVIWIPEISMLPVMPRPDSRVVAGALKLTLTFPSRPKLMAGMGMSGTVKGPTSRFPVTVRRGFSASTTVVVGMLMGPVPPLRVK
ncbi:Uncharacterised protein [Mycobacterium tuberculosis]|nr:Uncharacterised protein [Mycobacterium tuberculosis]CFH92566.1 Uncharacterised protein [Mycobacterium tuberculosis]CFJ85913.1 Uncharacterised protein [Mycobacterium tuberculosis]CFT13029.1 Uncharacterised protein [Mycobacterium tuberculosis]CLO92652.1 Uncharacterised protein [Mycobacterium tuberculosis]